MNVNYIINNEFNKKTNKFQKELLSGIYKGLLSSGNIKYFNKTNQLNLHNLYIRFSQNNKKLDIEAVELVFKQLEFMIHCTNKCGITGICIRIQKSKFIKKFTIRNKINLKRKNKFIKKEILLS